MNTKFFEFNQNNSGGYFDTDDNVCHRVIIEAETEEQAKEIFKPMIENASSSCPCCGDRWGGYCDEKTLDDFKNGYSATIYTHYKDYETRWETLYGSFKRKEEPKLSKEYGFTKYGTTVFFDTINDYFQLMANMYGQTTPDIRVHLLNGEKIEFNSVKVLQ